MWGSSAYGDLVGKTERKRTLGRPRLRGEDSIKNDLAEVVWRHVLD